MKSNAWSIKENNLDFMKLKHFALWKTIKGIKRQATDQGRNICKLCIQYILTYPEHIKNSQNSTVKTSKKQKQINPKQPNYKMGKINKQRFHQRDNMKNKVGTWTMLNTVSQNHRDEKCISGC